MNKLNNIAGIFVVLPSFSAGVITTYYYDGTTLIAEETAGAITVYLYDSTGSPVGMKYRTSSYAYNTWDTYWFEKNLQGDIIGVYSNTGTKLITYTYDPWGEFSTTYSNSGDSTTAVNNNLRYRGYYYDSDLQLYYLISRYYDSNTGRFISPDKYVSTGQGLLGYNMYAYCGNNPISRKDEEGEFFILAAGIALFLSYTMVEEVEKAAAEHSSPAPDSTQTDNEERDLLDAVGDLYAFDSESVKLKNNNFDFKENPNYTFFNAGTYAKYIKKNYYLNDDTRSVYGLYYELQVHYFLYLVGNEHGTNGADMRAADWDEDWNAVIFEFMGTFTSILEQAIYSPKQIWG